MVLGFRQKCTRARRSCSSSYFVFFPPSHFHHRYTMREPYSLLLTPSPVDDLNKLSLNASGHAEDEPWCDLPYISWEVLCSTISRFYTFFLLTSLSPFRLFASLFSFCCTDLFSLLGIHFGCFSSAQLTFALVSLSMMIFTHFQLMLE